MPLPNTQAGTDVAGRASPLDQTPDWFEKLMMPEGGKDHSRVILIPEGRRSLILKGDPDDEIAEKWRELSALAVVAIVAITLLVGGILFRPRLDSRSPCCAGARAWWLSKRVSDRSVSDSARRGSRRHSDEVQFACRVPRSGARRKRRALPPNSVGARRGAAGDRARAAR